MIPISILLADTILARYPDPDSMPYQPWSYSQGYILAGLEKLWQSTGNPTYFAYIHKFVDQHVNPDGSLLGFTGVSQDDMMAGTIVVAIYQHTGEKKYLRAAQHIRQMFDGYPRNSDGGFWHAKDLPNQMWIDGIFMMGMFLARYGAGMQASTNTFMTLTVAQFLQSISCRSETTTILDRSRPGNRYLGMAIAGSLGLQALTVLLPPLRGLLRLSPLALVDLLMIMAGSGAPFFINETAKTLRLTRNQESKLL